VTAPAAGAAFSDALNMGLVHRLWLCLRVILVFVTARLPVDRQFIFNTSIQCSNFIDYLQYAPMASRFTADLKADSTSRTSYLLLVMNIRRSNAGI